MSHRFDPRHFPIPRRGARFTIGAVARVLAAAEKVRHLPAPVARQRDQLAESYLRLRSAVESRGRAPTGGDAQAADRAEDGAWRALSLFLRAVSLLGDEPGTIADEVIDVLFADGLGFLSLDYASEWAEAEERLGRIDGARAEAIQGIGGGPFLAHLRAVHKRYGEAVGATAPRAVAPPALPVRPVLEEVMTSLRGYVVKVMGNVDEAQPASVRTADALLAPFADWPRPARKPPARKPDAESAGQEAIAPPK